MKSEPLAWAGETLSSEWEEARIARYDRKRAHQRRRQERLQRLGRLLDSAGLWVPWTVLAALAGTSVLLFIWAICRDLLG